MTSALITGITGQCGSYLAGSLLDKGYKVWGTYRRLSTPNFWRLHYLGIYDKVHLIPMELIDGFSVMEAIRQAGPDEIYHLAAQSFVGISFEQSIGTGEITGLGTVRILEGIRQINPEIKFYQASSSEIFGGSDEEYMNEYTRFRPCSPYAAAKIYAHHMVSIYREAYGIYACNGILFNHESPLRGLEFVTRKISDAAARIALGIGGGLKLGNLDAKRDWGYAKEYVESMYLMLQQTLPDDYVIATGETRSVRDFVERAFGINGMDYRLYLEQDPNAFRPLDVAALRGDCSKARNKLGWRPMTHFDDLVTIMVEEDMDRWRRYIKGEHFAWDAPMGAG